MLFRSENPFKLFEQLRGNFQVEYKSLEEQVDDFEFEEAREVVLEMAKALNILIEDRKSVV